MWVNGCILSCFHGSRQQSKWVNLGMTTPHAYAAGDEVKAAMLAWITLPAMTFIKVPRSIHVFFFFNIFVYFSYVVLTMHVPLF